jgi:hypothetical protein
VQEQERVLETRARDRDVCGEAASAYLEAAVVALRRRTGRFAGRSDCWMRSAKGLGEGDLDFGRHDRRA